MINIRSLSLAAILAGGISLPAMAQYASEAINYGNTSVQGTARSMGFGNALGSVGGDFSSLSVNPAGIGIYRTSELTFTPSLKINSAEGKYLGTSTSDDNTRFTVNNFGLVFTSAAKGERYKRRAWKSFSFALGMNRIADFNTNYTYQGVNNTSSATQAYEADANQYPQDVYYTNTAGPGYIGYNSYLINPTAADTNKFYSVVPYQGGINQKRSVQQTGGISEYLIAFGGNYKEKLMLGMTIGIPSVNYHRNTQYSEALAAGNTAPNPDNFSSYSTNETLDITGGGINAKIGAIYKVTDYLRFGAAFHSPTYYSLHDVDNQSVVAEVGGETHTLSPYDGSLPGNTFDYNFTTPWKAVLSGTFLFKQYGFVSVDYEYVGYNSMRYKYSGDYADAETAINQDIKNNYKGASNFRIGAEGVLGKYFMVRLGGGYYGNPYKESGVDASRVDLSAGLGFHFKHFFTDLGFVHSMYKGEGTPYNIDYSFITEPAATVSTTQVNYSVNNLALTLGVKF